VVSVVMSVGLCVGSALAWSHHASAADRESESALEALMGLAPDTGEMNVHKATSERIQKAVSERSEELAKRPGFLASMNRLHEVERQLGSAEDELFEAVAADPGIEPMRQQWRDCMGGRFISEVEIVQMQEEGARRRASGESGKAEIQNEIALSRESEACTKKALKSVGAAFPRIYKEWRAKHRSLGAEYKKAMTEVDAFVK
jgi:hypothetical protein